MPDAEPLDVGRASPDGVLVPRDGTEPVTVPSAGSGEVGIGLPSRAQEAGTTEDGTVVLPARGGGAEVALQAVDTSTYAGVGAGLRTLLVIDRQAAPRDYAFDLDLPPGATLRRARGGAVVALDGAGSTLGVFAPPWAVDADGRHVRTRFRVSANDTLIQTVRHRGAAYPVIADPFWLVPVAVVGARVALRIVVKAATKKGAKRAARNIARNAGREIADSGQGQPKQFETFTRRHFRANLVIRTGRDPSHCQAHHTMPIRWAGKFEKRGINIHHVRWGRWWNSTPKLDNNHQRRALWYNRMWGQFFEDHPRASRKEVLELRSNLVRHYASWFQC